ncbi:haloacid dehalogenase-like hydrolase domain-containing protein 2-like protein [Basidiobolus meristosporus CBS 931.73]|uniref:Haloacid dehalogenase-like hydrolase domain-containing protein 2 n=1 Tax=Basidiobolus meristosporus CBS 931.73 TaxID=1314790 RepID=A0A1Y1Y8C7_9FUNG|nr:haloacid dehalogenase-like hydrolase domain-containing protein 2-like protein [Basidiobolus meristosporus CBS 931.73]|eukprot:ORX93996.1 haloacid dehalogenase-like hydrolase domain-containing protein 2-like protein [Basidiobolus meristosporus CBS 931.73]
MNSIKGVLIDLSGTLHVDNKAIDGAVLGLKKLYQSGIQFRFCTNTTKESRGSLIRKLNQMGFDVSTEQVFTSLSAAKNLVKAQNLRPLLLLEKDALNEFSDLPQDEPYNAVVVGLSPSSFEYSKLNQAFRLVMGGAPLIAIHKARYFAEKDGLSLGPGGFVQCIEYATGAKAQTVGKPEKKFFELALSDMGLLDSPSQVVMIGDDVCQDLGGGAEELGLIRYLVKTGKYQIHDESKYDTKPDQVFQHFGEAVDFIIKHNATEQGK